MFNKLERRFHLRANHTNVSTEIIAGMTTFFAMAYILFVNPRMLTLAGTVDNPLPVGAVFLATIFASVIGTLIMAFFANVPYAQAPGMGINAFFTFTVCAGLGFTWQQGLAMVFLCGIINVIVTVTRLRKIIISSIPPTLQYAIGGGIGLFVAYIGIHNAGLLNFADGMPSLSLFNSPRLIFAVVALIVTITLVVLKVPAAIFIAIIGTTVIGVPFGVTQLTSINPSSIGENFKDLGVTVGAAFGMNGLGTLFSDAARIPLVLATIFVFSLTDTFDTIGTFVGTGMKAGLFSDQGNNETHGKFETRLEKALLSDSIATSVGAFFGTSNTTVYVESATGIGVGGRTGLTSLTTAIMFLCSIVLAPIVALVPSEAAAPALVVVGIMMASSFARVKWDKIEEAVPAFFAGVFMSFCYSISYGIAAGFIFYCVTKIAKRRVREIHPVIWISSLLFLLNFIILGIVEK